MANAAQKSFSLSLGFINLDIGFVSDLSCSMAMSFLQKMAVHAALPLLLLLTILLARLPSIFSSHKRTSNTTKSIDDQTTFFASTNIISWTLYTVVCFFKKSDGDWLLASATHGVAKYLLWITQYRSFWRRTSSVCNLMYCVHGGLCVRYSTRCLCCTARQSQIFTFCWRHRGASFTT